MCRTTCRAHSHNVFVAIAYKLTLAVNALARASVSAAVGQAGRIEPEFDTMAAAVKAVHGQIQTCNVSAYIG